MSYSAYDSYKASGLEWLGDLPSGWEVRKVSHSLEYSVGFTPESGNALYYGEGYDWANISDLGVKYLSKTEKQITSLAIKHSNKKIVKKGSLLYSFKLSVGLVSIPKIDMYTNEAIAAFQQGKTIYLPFMYYMAPETIIHNASTNIYGASILNQEAIGNAKLIVPPMVEQKAIAAFLDEKTLAIDNLIAKKEKLLDLLAEKRTALITKAVTKGLNSTTPMKPSGIDWIGDIPAGWAKKKMSWFFIAEKGKNSQMFTKDYCGLNPGEHPVYSGQTTNNGVMGKVDSYEYDFGRTGCLFSTTVGAKAMTVDHLFGKFNLSQNCMIMSAIPKVSLRYYYYFFTALFGFERGLVSEHMQASFRVDDFYEYKILLPELSEQEKIATYLDHELREFEKIENRISLAISKLKEYRAAIITNAVTGKIKVI